VPPGTRTPLINNFQRHGNAGRYYRTKAAQDELLQRTKLESLGTFAGGVAKDFDNLLSAILRNVFLAKISAADEDKIIEDGLAVAERAACKPKNWLTSEYLRPWWLSGS